MRMTRNHVLVGLGGLAARAAFGAPPAAAADLTPVNWGTMPTDGSAQVFYGIDKSFFKDAGFDVQLTVLNNTASLASAVASGALEIGFGSVVPLAQAHLRGLEFRVIAPAAVYTGTTANNVIMVGKASTVKSGKDLNGQTVAVNGLRDLTQYEMQAWIDKNGGDLRTIRIIETPFSEMGTALETGRVAAAIMAEPYTTAALAQGRVVGDASAAVAKRFMITGWFAEAGWLAKNPDEAKRLQAALLQTARFGNVNHAETQAIITKYTKITPEVAQKMTRTIYGDMKPDPALIQPVLDLAMKYGGMAPVAATDLIWSG
jgi:NitT/TauT family transport system substrate-binding protein